MKKLQNEREHLVEQAIDGYARAHRDVLAHVPGTYIIERRVPKAPGKVRLAMGNGSGHEPAVIGWVGTGMFDMNIDGEVFTAPSGKAIFQGLKWLCQDGPAILFVQNHAGDVLNADIAMELAEEAQLPVKSVLFYDDIASAPKGMESERRGMAGMIFYAKICGAMAERGATTDEIIAMFERVRDATRTLSVAITTATHPVTGLPMGDDLGGDIEVGMGVHGEGGASRMPLPTSCELAALLCERLIADGEYAQGDQLLVMVNGAGSMTMMEMATLYGDIEDELKRRGIAVAGCKVGNFLTTQEMSGVSVSFAKVDEQMLALWNDPCDAPAF